MDLIIFSDDQEKEFPEIVDAYSPFKSQIVPKLELAKELVSQHAKDPYNEEIWKDARKIRLAIRKDRIALDKKRKELKDMAKRYVDAVDIPPRNVRKVCEAQEEALQKIENFEQEQELKRKLSLEKDRKEQIEKLGVDPDHYPNLSAYDYTAFDTLLLGIEAQIKRKAEEEAEAKRKAEEAEKARGAELAEAKRKAEEAEAKRLAYEKEQKQLQILRQERYSELAQYGITQTKSDPAEWSDEQYKKNLESAIKWHKEKEANDQLRGDRLHQLTELHATYSGDLAELTNDAFKQVVERAIVDLKQKEAEMYAKAKRKEDERIAREEAEAKRLEGERIAKAKLDKAYQEDHKVLQRLSPALKGLIDKHFNDEAQKSLTTEQGLQDYNTALEMLTKLVDICN